MTYPIWTTEGESLPWDVFRQGQCLIVETHNTVYHVTCKEHSPSLRWEAEGGEYLSAKQRISPIGAVVEYEVRWTEVAVGLPFMFVRCSDGARVVTSPVLALALLPEGHGEYISRFARRELEVKPHDIR